MIFVLAFVLMFSLERVVLWFRRMIGHPAKILPLFHGKIREVEDRDQWSGLYHLVGRPAGYVCCAVLAAVAAGAWWLNRPGPPGLNQAMVATLMPETLTIGGRQLTSHAIELDEKTRTILEDPSYCYRRYYAEGAPAVYFCLLFSKDNRKGIHPPDLCLQGSGEGIVAKSDIDAGGIAGHASIPCRELIIDTRGGKEYFLYTYKCGNRYTRSFWLQQLTIFANGVINRNAGGALVRVSTPAGDDLGAARRRAVETLRAAVPHLDENLP